MSILGIDLGSTHIKAGLFRMDGQVLKIASRETPRRKASAGWSYFDPDELWHTALETVQEAVGDRPEAVEAVGIAGMAETGLLLDRRTGLARSPFLPWFDTSAETQAQFLRLHADPLERFCRTGIRPTFKCSLAKLLWLRDQAQVSLEDAAWCSAEDYLAFRLTGALATDPTLAGRTYAFRVDHQEWDAEWLDALGLSPELFPAVLSSGKPLGGLLGGLSTGLAEGTPVAIAGHDHVVASFGVGAAEPGQAFDSMGTAESFMGTRATQALSNAEYAGGLAYGCYVRPGRQYWSGGISASGGSLEWLRGVLGEPPLSYETLNSLLDQVDDRPGDLLFFPYLTGSGSPHNDPVVRGAFLGLHAGHRPAQLVKAVLEGVAYEVEFIRRTAEQANGLTIRQVTAAGGGTRNRSWMQIKANITGCEYAVSTVDEAVLLGAALLAGLGSGLYASEADALRSAALRPAQIYRPDPQHQEAYQNIFEQGYLAVQDRLRQVSHTLDRIAREAKATPSHGNGS